MVDKYSSLTHKELKELLHYDPETGVFTWLKFRGRTAKKGWRAGSRVARQYYRVIVIKQKHYPEHRLAWFYIHGEWPKGDIDHINGLPYDNRICNIRDVTTQENCQNQRRVRSDNRSGLMGVTSCPTGKYAAYVTVRGNRIYLGRYDTAQEAHKAYIKGKRKHHEFSTL